MQWSFRYWLVEVTGLSLCILGLAFIGAGVAVQTLYQSSVGLAWSVPFAGFFVLGLVIAVAGLRLKPGTHAQAR